MRPVVDLVLYNAGVDLHEACAIGGLVGMTDEVVSTRERVVFQWAKEHQLPIAFVLAGGYAGPRLTQEHLVQLHRYTIEAAAASEQHPQPAHD